VFFQLGGAIVVQMLYVGFRAFELWHNRPMRQGSKPLSWTMAGRKLLLNLFANGINATP